MDVVEVVLQEVDVPAVACLQEPLIFPEAVVLDVLAVVCLQEPLAFSES